MNVDAENEDKEVEELEAEILALAENEEVEATEEVEDATETDVEEDESSKEETDESNAVEEDNRESESESEEEEVKPDNSAYARMRHENKKLKDQLAAAAERKAETDGATVSDSVSKLVEAWDTGEGDEKALLANVRKASSKELHDIYQKAVAGEYGETSDDVIAMVQREMPMVQQREVQSSADAEARSNAVRKSLEDELNMAQSDFPELAKEDSEGAKFLNEFVTSVAGTLDPKTGELDGGELPEDLAVYLHTHPYVMYQMADKVFKAKTYNSDTSRIEMAKVQKERDTLKARLEMYEGIEAPSSSAKTGGEVSDDSLEDLEKQILAAVGG